MSGLRVLFVEGEPLLEERLEAELRACVDAVSVASARSAAAVEQALASGRWDAIVLGSDAPVDAARVASLARAHDQAVPILTGSPEALLGSLRRLRRILELRNAALARTERELHAREEQLRHAQKMEVIGTFTGTIAHDFNNIVLSIGGYAALLLQDWPAGHPGREDLEEIVRAAEQAKGLTRQLLDFARRDAQPAQRIDLVETIRDVDQLLRRSAGGRVQVDVRLQGDAEPVRADANQVQQVLLNLVLNARDAMPTGGHVLVEVEDVELAVPLDGVGGRIDAGRWVRLRVQDDGAGMDEETRRRAFEPFFTTKPAGRGTGLGLAIVHEIVKRAGAHLALTTAPRAGTTFDIFFPPDTTTNGARPNGRPDERLTILLVEDEPALASLVQRMLRRAGYEVRIAHDAGEALAVARDAGELHLLLTDVVLPGGNGWEIARGVNELRPGLPTLFMSGYGDDVAQRAGLDMARARILDKPFRPDDLYSAVREVLDAATYRHGTV